MKRMARVHKILCNAYVNPEGPDKYWHGWIILSMKLNFVTGQLPN